MPVKKTLLAAILALVVQAVFAEPSIVVTALFKNKAMVEIDGRRHLLSLGETGPEGVRLVAADADGAILEVDGQRRKFALGSRQGASYTAPKERVVRVSPDDSGMYFVDGVINGRGVNFVVDTGANLVALSEADAKRLRIDYRDGRPAKVSTAGGTVDAFVVTLARVKVGAIELREVDAVVIEGSAPERPLLGMSFLGRVELRNDGRVLSLTQR